MLAQRRSFHAGIPSILAFRLVSMNGFTPLSYSQVDDGPSC